MKKTNDEANSTKIRLLKTQAAPYDHRDERVASR
jgi:hypothetical protein